MAAQQFAEFISEAILSLPQDLKAVLRIVEDPDIDDAGRQAAAGALIHVLSASNAIPGMRGILAYVDDVLVLRLIMERLSKTSPEAMARHREESPELLADLDGQLAIARRYLGELMSVLDAAADGVSKLNHQGHTAAECAADTDGTNWLYDAVHAAIVEELEFDEDEVQREAKGVDKILPHLRSRIAAGG
jgi:uncharacterized membrane protein YkvA (DUF1232 family)